MAISETSASRCDSKGVFSAVGGRGGRVVEDIVGGGFEGGRGEEGAYWWGLVRRRAIGPD